MGLADPWWGTPRSNPVHLGVPGVPAAGEKPILNPEIVGWGYEERLTVA